MDILVWRAHGADHAAKRTFEQFYRTRVAGVVAGHEGRFRVLPGYEADSASGNLVIVVPSAIHRLPQAFNTT